MKAIRWSVLPPALLLGINVAWSQNASQATARRPAGYLSAAQVHALSRSVPAAPKPGDSRDVDDRAIFRATRSFDGSPRWTLAQQDNEISVPAILNAYSCALGFLPTADTAPKLTRLLSRATVDSGALSTDLKDLYSRKRPFLVEKGSICIEASPSFSASPDYPSGHSTFGWTSGLILAELVPSKASDILTRAAAYGESRVVCGVHNASAVDAGRSTAAVVVATLHGSAEFRADLEAARAEITGLLNSASQAQRCAAEAELIGSRPY